MIKIIFTLDYEIHGNGRGSPLNLMVKPTYQIIKLFDEYGAKLTVMADIAEILKFKEYKQKYMRDGYYYNEVEDQLKYIISRKHDVQLHIHSSYFKALYNGGRWKQYWDEYNLAGLDYKRLYEMIKYGKSYLESLLMSIEKDYRCFVFRAANWSMYPSSNIIQALIENGILFDTSIFKYGRRKGIVNFDYSDAYSDLIPWPADDKNICIKKSDGKLLEFPIFCRKMRIWNFLTINRIYGAILSKLNAVKQLKGVKQEEKTGSFLKKILSILITKFPLKMDFNQCTGRQLIQGLKFAFKKYDNEKIDLPFILIGHSKLFNRINEKSLRPFLKYITQNKEKYTFSTFEPYYNSLDELKKKLV